MSSLGAALLTWTAIATYATLFHGALYYYRRDAARGNLAYSLFSACQVVYFGALWLRTWTSNGSVAVQAAAIQVGAGTCMSAAFVQFAAALSGSRLVRVVPATWVTAAVGALLVNARLGGQPLETDWDPARASLVGALLYATLGPVAIACAILAVAMSSVALLTLLRHPRDRVEARILASVAVPVFVIAGVAVMPGVTQVTLGLLAEAGSIPVALACGLVLLRRFAQSATRLGTQSIALEQSYEDLRHTQETLVRKEQLAAVGELSAVIAHEVRNPLAILKNAVSGLRRRAIGADDRRVLLGIVNEETERLARLVRDLLAYARPLSPVRSPTRLRELVERAWNDGRLDKTRGSVTLELDIPASLAVMVDRDHASYALVNVIENALVAMGGRGPILLRAQPTTHRERAAVALDVIDAGPGMEPGVLSKAREPFFTTRPSGTGLGLAIVDRVVRGHEGSVDIESRVGEGTRVRLVLPAWEPALAEGTA